jgi:hypothetical protein
VEVFKLRDQLVEDYRQYAEPFLAIKDERIRAGGMTSGGGR